MRMEIFIKGSDSMIRLMAQALIHMLMVPSTRGNGKKIGNMEGEWKYGPMEPGMMEITNLARSMERVF